MIPTLDRPQWAGRLDALWDQRESMIRFAARAAASNPRRSFTAPLLHGPHLGLLPLRELPHGAHVAALELELRPALGGEAELPGLRCLRHPRGLALGEADASGEIHERPLDLRDRAPDGTEVLFDRGAAAETRSTEPGRCDPVGSRLPIVTLVQAALQREFDGYGAWFNAGRPHEFLAGATPDERLLPQDACVQEASVRTARAMAETVALRETTGVGERETRRRG
jgi:hypothetical protein